MILFINSFCKHFYASDGKKIEKKYGIRDGERGQTRLCGSLIGPYRPVPFSSFLAFLPVYLSIFLPGGCLNAVFLRHVSQPFNLSGIQFEPFSHTTAVILIGFIEYGALTQLNAFLRAG